MTYNLKSKKLIKKGLVVLALILIFQNAILAINNFQNKTAVVGLKLDNKDLTGLGRPQIGQYIEQQIKQKNSSLKLKFKDQTLEVKPAEIGAQVDTGELTNQLLEQGRTGNFIQKIIKQDQALLGLNNQSVTGVISQPLLTTKILEIKDQIEQDSTPAMPDFSHNINQTLPKKDGIKVHSDKLTSLIVDNIFNPPNQALEIPTFIIFANDHDPKELDPIRKQAIELVKIPISITSGGQTLVLSTEDLLSMLTIVEKPDPKDSQKQILNLRLGDKKLHQRLGQFAQKVEAVTQAEFDHHDAEALIYAQFYSQKSSAYSKRRDLTDVPTGLRIQKKVLGTDNTGPKIVYLTFDDGPNSIYHPLILDILKTYDVKATFFLVGLNTQRDLSVAQRTVDEGHVIGNHSLTHSFLPKLASTQVSRELLTTNKILKPINHNQDLTLFRPPYGGVNLVVKQKTDDLKLKLTLWDVDPRDWSEPSTDELVKRVVFNTYPSADILLHSNHIATVKALPKIIETLKNQGYSFETLK